MSKAKYTPGPWKVRNTDIYDRRGFFLASGGIADTRLRGQEYHEAREYCEGNARLMAAAPELLAACVAIIEWGDCEQDHSVGFSARLDLCRAAFDSARAAIAKATGEQP